MTESVTIEATTPLVSTSSSELGTTVTNEQIEALPLNGRNFVSLTRTVPGVLRGIPGANIDGAGSLAWRASASFSANGQRPRDNNYMLDGVDNNETWLQTVVIFPSVDALDEFKLQTSTYSAEFGRSLGGVVNLQIKSGTNAYRGSAFEFHAQRRVRREQLLQQPRRPAEARLQAEPVRRHVRRPDLQGQHVLLRRLPGTPRGAGPDVPLHRARRWRCGTATSRRSTASIYDPTTGQPFAGKPHPGEPASTASRATSSTQLYPEPNTRPGSTAASGQNIDNYLINPVKERQDNQFDVKVDHNLSTNNRFFTRYSYQKTHRLQPATLPHGDAGATFGAGDGNIKGQSLAFNDTHTLQQQLAERVPLRVVVDQVPDDARSTTAPTRRTPSACPASTSTTSTSAMTQLTFQNIRNLGANGNQPLITNQNDFQVFDNVTWIKGKHTLKAGGSLTFRSREILNADSIVGNFSFNNNMTSNCAGLPAGCTVNSSYRVRRRELPARLHQHEDPQPVRRRDLHREAPGVRPLPSGRLARQREADRQPGLRWDVYPPWIEIDDRQSNFDESTGKFVVASDNAVINGVEVGPLPADLLEGRRRAARRVRLRPRRRRQDASSAAASACSGTSRPAARARRRRRTRRSCSRRR